jgi:hypothetical protein
MQLSELLLNRQLYKVAQETSTQDASYMSVNSSQSSAYGNVSTGAGEAAYAVNSNTPTVSGTKIRAGYIDSENYVYVSGNYTVSGMQIDLNNGIIRSRQFFIDQNGNAYFAGNISATTGSIGGWTIGATALTGGGVTLSSTGYISAASSNGKVEMNAATNAFEVYDSVGQKRIGMSTYYLSFFDSLGDESAFLYSRPEHDIGFKLYTDIGQGFVGAFYDLTLSSGAGSDIYLSPQAGRAVIIAPSSGLSLGGVTRGSWPSSGTTVLSGLTIDTDKNWAGYRIFNMASLTIAPGGYITLDGVARTTWPSGGTTTLSGLTIDVVKNWNSYGISSLGTVTQDPSATFSTNWLLVTGGAPQIGTSGGRFFTYASTLNYTTLVNGSDRALKENITPIAYGLDTISSLVPVRYKYIESPEYHLGFIAQDVEGVIPEIVSVDEETEMLGLSSTEIIAILVKAVQELRQEVELLKASH